MKTIEVVAAIIKKQDKMQECLQKYIAMSIIKQRLKEEKYA